MPDISKLVFHVSDALEKLSTPPEEPVLLQLVAAHAAALSLTEGQFSEADIDQALRIVQSQFITRMDLGTLFQAEDYRPWLYAARGSIDPYYWERYRKHLRKQGLPKQVVGTMDRVTEHILDHLEDPNKEGAWTRRGLVVGHVQSGKTANYTGLIAKAADAGYKVIIVLAGMLNSLRNQTQERLDSDFIGKCSITRMHLGASDFGNTRTPITFTTAKEDFNKNSATSHSLELAAVHEPVIFVIKKNPSTLKNLCEWLVGNNRHNLKDFPMLLVDDEADHASINISNDDATPTTINRLIREVLQLFPRGAFVGYTATPFANIFIDPSSEDEMANGDLYKDLFPRDFIYSLDPPSNYVGASQLFLDEGELDCLRDITDTEELFPVKHKIHFEPGPLPPSLIEAIDAFIIAKAIRLLRNQNGMHHSMMINLSRFTGVQNKVRDLVDDIIRKSREAVGSYAALAAPDALQNRVIRRFHQRWTEDYSDSGFDWPEVQGKLKEAIDPVDVISVNRKGTGTLDYSKGNYPNGRSIIAIGGLGLSRGLTLQGLICSYFHRNSIMYDTLMQMGRWFGYRPDYADLCRIYMTTEAHSWYTHVAGAIEELRSDFRDMERAGLTPLEFGFRVRSHPTALMVTARNKMRSAQEIPVSISLEGRLAETSVLLGNTEILKENQRTLEDLLVNASKLVDAEASKLGPFWRGVPSDLVEMMIKDFKNHPECILTSTDPMLEMIRLLRKDGIETFDVLLRSGREGGAQMVAGHQIKPVYRTVSSRSATRIEFNNRRVGSRGDERAGIDPQLVQETKKQYLLDFPGKEMPDKEYRKIRAIHNLPPLLMIVFAAIKTKEDKDKKDAPTVVVPSYGVGFPGDPSSSRRPKKLIQYRVNTVWWEKNVLSSEDEEEME